MTRKGKVALIALVSKVQQNTAKRGEEVKEERTRQKTEREKIAGKCSEMLNNGRQTPKEVLNWKMVRSWFHAELVRNFGDKHSIPPENIWWTGKEISLAKKLLALYSGALIQEGIVHLCESWEAMVENSSGKLSGIPTMGFLWSVRERIIGAVEAGEQPTEKKGRKRHHQAEYDAEDDDMPRIGW